MISYLSSYLLKIFKINLKYKAGRTLLTLLILFLVINSSGCLKRDTDKERDKQKKSTDNQEKTGKEEEKITLLQGERKNILSKGRKIAYWRDGLVYLYDLKTKKSQEIFSIKNVIALSWAADNKNLALLKGLGKQNEAGEYQNTEIFIINIESKEGQPLSISPGKILYPSWDSSGTRIAYTRVFNEKEQDIYFYDFTRSREYPLTSDGKSFMPAWSPDGKSIAYLRGQDKGNYSTGFKSLNIWEIKVETGQKIKISSFKESKLTGQVSIFSLNWLVNGREIAYLDLSNGVIGTINIEDKKTQVIPIKLNGQKLHRELAADFEGKQFLIVLEEQINPSVDPIKIMLLDRDSKKMTELIKGSYFIAWY